MAGAHRTVHVWFLGQILVNSRDRLGCLCGDSDYFGAVKNRAGHATIFLQRQRNNVIKPQGLEKIKINIYFSVSRWSNHNKCSNIVIANNFVARKYGDVVATELSRAQLW